MCLRRISLNLIIYILIPPNFQELCLEFFNFPNKHGFTVTAHCRGVTWGQTDDEAQIFLWLLLVKN